MDNNKKNRTFREAYVAALKGEEFQIREKSARKRLQSTRYKAGTFGMGAASIAVIVALVSMSIAWPDSYESSVWTLVAGFILPLGSGYAGDMLAWRMLRGNVLEQSFAELRACPADQDGVKRTDEERVFLAGPFGTTAMVIYGAGNIVRDAKANYGEVARTISSTDDPELIDVGNTLSRVSDRLVKLEHMLEEQWSTTPADCRATPLTRASLRDVCQQLAVVSIQAVDCYTFIYRYFP